jgi:limonene-1,2-epoxide hydrolase
MEPITVVEHFFARWLTSHDEMRQSFHDTMTPDCVWTNVGIATTVGPDQALAFMDGFTDKIPFRTIRVEWVSSGVNESLVYAERVDVLVGSAGNDLKRVPVLGVLDIREGRIAAWRDYFDTASA